MEIEVSGGSTGCGCGGCLSGVLSLGFSLMLMTVIMFSISMSHKGSDAAALALINQCPAITNELGGPVTIHPISMGCGETSSGGGSGSASWTMSLRGSKANASASYVARYTGNAPWEVSVVNVTMPSGERIDATRCPTAKPEKPHRDRPRPDQPRKGRKGGRKR